jgi:hypothetical protein
MKKYALLFLAFLPLLAGAQGPPTVTPPGQIANAPAPDNKAQRKARPAWIGISYGLDFDNYRDLATSPLFYSGVLQAASLDFIRSDARRFSDFGATVATGANTSFAGRSKVTSVFLHWARLYQIPAPRFDRWNFKVGGLLSVTGNERINRSLGNSTQGIEGFANLMASGRVEWDISRREEKRKKLLFVRFYLPPRRKNLAFQLNLGVVNSSFRNGYAYLRQSGLLNEPGYFDRYQFRVFSGFRMGSALDYTVFLKNNNGLRLSYIWDAYTTGGDADRYVMAHHLLRFSFLFNTK